MMDVQTISSLLRPFLAKPPNATQLKQISAYLDLLLKWNSKMNLTSVRQPEEMIARHFGESLFAAQVLSKQMENRHSLLDLGSGAGFPGLPIKIALPDLQVVLAESQHKKAMFLKEVTRSLGLSEIAVHAGRAEELKREFEVVTMRAVDGQKDLLRAASHLISSGGLLLLMLGSSGVDSTKAALPNFTWKYAEKIPPSTGRWILIGEKQD
jgi:16S rRNA (guanine527-N7)-methyltransferase